MERRSGPRHPAPANPDAGVTNGKSQWPRRRCDSEVSVLFGMPLDMDCISLPEDRHSDQQQHQQELVRKHPSTNYGDGGEPRSCRILTSTSPGLKGFLTSNTCISDRCILRIDTLASMLTSATSRWIGLECTLTTWSMSSQPASKTWKPLRRKRYTRKRSGPSSPPATRTVG